MLCKGRKARRGQDDRQAANGGWERQREAAAPMTADDRDIRDSSCDRPSGVI